MSGPRGRDARCAALRLGAKRIRLAADVIAKTGDYRGGNCGCNDYDLPDYMTDEDVMSLHRDFARVEQPVRLPHSGAAQRGERQGATAQDRAPRRPRCEVSAPAPLTDADLAAIEALTNASLDGPWAFEVYQIPPGTKRPDGVGPSGKIHSDGFPIAAMVDEAEGEFIAHAREDVPRLLSALRKARRALREAAEHIESGATIIEAEIGDLDGECAEEREFAASLRSLAGGAK